MFSVFFAGNVSSTCIFNILLKVIFRMTKISSLNLTKGMKVSASREGISGSPHFIDGINLDGEFATRFVNCLTGLPAISVIEKSFVKAHQNDVDEPGVCAILSINAFLLMLKRCVLSSDIELNERVIKAWKAEGANTIHLYFHESVNQQVA